MARVENLLPTLSDIAQGYGAQAHPTQWGDEEEFRGPSDLGFGEEPSEWDGSEVEDDEDPAQRGRASRRAAAGPYGQSAHPKGRGRGGGGRGLGKGVHWADNPGASQAEDGTDDL